MQYLIPLTLLLAPTYAWRINLFGLPTNIFMLWIFSVWIIFSVFLITQKQIIAFEQSLKKTSGKILLFTGLFFLSGVISLLTSGVNQKTMGEFLVLFIQPLSLFFIGRYLFEKFPTSKSSVLYTLYFILFVSGLFALAQYFTGLGLPVLFSGNDVETRRAVSFFTHSNFYALWAAPLLGLLIPNTIKKIKNWKLAAAWIIGVVGLGLSFSRAGWFGIASAIIVFLILSGDKKIRQTAAWLVVVAAIVVILAPPLRHRLTSPFYGEKSASSRLTLWQSGFKAIKQSPVFGLGLGGYAKNYRQLITDQSLPDHNFPHNIFLDFWVETGLLGLVAIAGVIGIIMYEGLRNKKDLFKFSVALFLITLLVQGQIDNPYFKNDLAAIFWIVLAL